MRKDWRTTLGFAAVGLGITAAFVAYQVLMASPPRHPNIFLQLAFMILCAFSFLTISLIDVEIGAGEFYRIWTIVALMNASLYAGIRAAYVIRKEAARNATK